MNNFNKNISKIAIFRALKLGDMLCSIPAFRSMRYSFPHAYITLVGLPWAKEFTQRFHMYINTFIEFPGYPGLFEQTTNPKKIISFLANMQKAKFDLAIQMHGNGTITNSLISLFGARMTAGYYPVNEKKYCPNPATFLPYPEDENEIARHIRLMEFLGIKNQGSNLEFPLDKKDFLELQAIPEYFSLIPKKYVCIHPGSISAKAWEPKKFAQVGDLLAKKGFTVVLTGLANELQITNNVASTMKYPAINLAGKTSLGSIAALLKNAFLLVSNDTGISHVADALQIPSVIIYTTSDPKIWAPQNTNLHRIVLSNTYHDVTAAINEIQDVSRCMKYPIAYE